MNLKKQFGYPAKRGPLSAGFTLIELLVVVLIIGILSSVALPQYTKTVKRARAAEAWTIGKTYFDAQDVYLMENGFFAVNLDDLTVPLPVNEEKWTVTLGAGGINTYGDVGCSYLNISGKGSMEGTSFSYYLYPTDVGSGRRSMNCSTRDGYCPIMVPCAHPDIASGGNWASCPM
ncbi:MAG: prepilin-type N-terminal cleavage/methylation domain-containing protein [Elusimicrobiaceae bacterium]|nr:prepilin-type N-terminal cleavage/methylation domain-containing protein [Elusimicrobiaceae bacterium]